MSQWVFGEGPQPAKVLLCGERPGQEEYRSGRPFSEYGKSGREIRRYLFNEGIRFEDCYVTNTVKDYIEGNPDPTEEEIKRDQMLLVDEISNVCPRYIGLVGRFAARWFLPYIGEIDLEWAHGLPFLFPECAEKYQIFGYDEEKDAHKYPVLMPLYHVAYGLHSPHATPLVWSDYAAFGKLVRGELLELPKDEYPDAEYQLLKDSLPRFVVDAPIYIDTEGSVDCPWGLSWTQEPGKGYVILAKNTALLKRFAAVIKKLNLEVVCHPVIHDMGVLRAMGVEFDRYRCTMTKAFLNTLVPQGLKPLARRTCGVVQEDYEDVMAQANRDKAVDWLMKAWEWANANKPGVGNAEQMDLPNQAHSVSGSKVRSGRAQLGRPVRGTKQLRGTAERS